MFIGADDPGIHGDMVGHQGVRNDPFVQPEVFGGMAGVDGRDAGFKLLAVAAGMEGIPQIVLPEDGECGDRIADAVIGLAERFQAEEILGRGDQLDAGLVVVAAHVWSNASINCVCWWTTCSTLPMSTCLSASKNGWFTDSPPWGYWRVQRTRDPRRVIWTCSFAPEAIR